MVIKTETESIFREDTLPKDEQFKTIKEVAEYYRAHKIVRKYETHGEIWDIPDSGIQVGLLNLILDEIQEIRCTMMDPRESDLGRHSVWLNKFRERTIQLLDEWRRHSKRISGMFSVNVESDDIHFFEWIDIHRFSLLFRVSPNDHYRLFDLLVETNERIKQVKEPKDVSILKGIGTKKGYYLLQNIADSADGDGKTDDSDRSTNGGS